MHHILRLYIQTLALLLLCALLLVSCHPTKYVGENEYLVDEVNVVVEDNAVKRSSLTPYIKQQPNHRTFGLVGLPLFVYNLSGSDTTRYVNRLLRRLGTPPVLYDPNKAERSRTDMQKALYNRGYMNAVVRTDTVVNKRRVKVNYKVSPHPPYSMNRIAYHIPNDSIRQIVEADSAAYLLKRGDLFDQNNLELERQRLSKLLRDNGYYAFNKEYVNFTVDSTYLNRAVDVWVNVNDSRSTQLQTNDTTFTPHTSYTIGDVYFITCYDPISPDGRVENRIVTDTIQQDGYHIVYGERRYIDEATLVNNCHIEPGNLFSNKEVENTYNALGRLSILKSVNIRFTPSEEDADQLNCFILLSEGEPQSMSVEVEGTNSAGDLGFASTLTYQHRNLFKGSQVFTTKFRGAYESLSGDIAGIINDNYTELGGEVGITFPQFVFPFIDTSTRKRLRSTTDFDLNFNYQQRPEYSRVIAGGGWGYNWTSSQSNFKHKLDLVDISYIYLPDASDIFIESLDSLSADNPMLGYSYEDHFIMRMAYIFYWNNLKDARLNKNIYTFRAATEVAGNTLYALSNLTHQPLGEDGAYNFLGIRYAQYAKCDLDYSYTFTLSDKSSLALHAGTGVAIPYGNSEMIPFEKRYFSGGANSVRGWGVRTLGPGIYKSSNSITNFMNQCGDVRLDLNAEYRSKLFWKLEMALFVDAGNTWTVQEYPSQVGGVFQLDTFYKQIAMGYGLGLRIDFDFFLLRLDWGIKAYDPSRDIGSRWVAAYKNILDDTTLHFAVGYPF